MRGRSIVTLAALFIMALSVAVAAPKNKKTITISEPTLVGSVTLKPGEYTIEWNGTGPDVQVGFSRGNNIIVTVPATLEAAQNPDDISIRYHTGESGAAHLLVEIETRNLTLHFAAPSASRGE